MPDLIPDQFPMSARALVELVGETRRLDIGLELMSVSYQFAPSGSDPCFSIVDELFVTVNGRFKRRHGTAYHARPEIALHPRLLLTGMRDHLVSTLFHEIAHHVAGTRHGHDDVWRWTWNCFGFEPRRFYDGHAADAAHERAKFDDLDL